MTSAGTPSSNLPAAPCRFRGATTALLVAGVCALLCFTNAAGLVLTDPEESRCALVVQEMIEGGHWLMPHLEGKPYYDKPAPFFWLAAGGVKLTGSIELGGRLVPGLAAIFAVLVTFAFAKRLWGTSAGLLAGLILATSIEFLFLARWYRMDMPFAAFLWAALWWFYRYEKADTSAASGRRTFLGSDNARWIGFYAFCAAATLMKGPAGLVLPGLVVAAYFLFRHSPRRLAEFFNLPGLAVFLLIAAPWYVAVSLAVPHYFHEFFFVQNLERYSEQTMGRHTLYGVGYLVVLLVGMLPWTIYFPGVIARTFPRNIFRRSPGEGPQLWRRPEALFLWLAGGLWLLFFMCSKTQMVNYILPVFPPMAMLVALVLSRWAQSDETDKLFARGAAGLRITLLLLPALVAAAEFLMPKVAAGSTKFNLKGWRAPGMGWLDGWILLPAAAVVVLLIASLAAKPLRRKLLPHVAAAASVAIFLYMALHTLPAVYDNKLSQAAIGKLARQNLLPGDELCILRKPELSFILYAGRREAPTLNKSHGGWTDEAKRLADAGKPLLCLAQDTGDKEELEQFFHRPFYVAASHGSLLLLSDRPPGGTGPAENRKGAP